MLNSGLLKLAAGSTYLQIQIGRIPRAEALPELKCPGLLKHQRSQVLVSALGVLLLQSFSAGFGRAPE